MWTVIYIAPNKEKAEKIKQILAEEGVLVQLKTVSSQQGSGSPVEILAPESEAEEAHEVLQRIIR